MDGKILMGVVVGIRAKVLPRVWKYRSDSRELKVWRGGVSGEGFICGNSLFSCLVVNRRVWSEGLRDRGGRK